ncbi:hypothetical protein HAX54_011256, partial [Datura stramonium]|nr:hypothetical protein [Datura stramonium]
WFCYHLLPRATSKRGAYKNKGISMAELARRGYGEKRVEATRFFSHPSSKTLLDLATSTLDFLDSRRFTYQNQVNDGYLNDKVRKSSVYFFELQWCLMIIGIKFITHRSRRRNFRFWRDDMVNKKGDSMRQRRLGK